MNRQTFFKLLGFFLISRIALFLLSFAADRFLSYKPSFSLINLTLIPSGLPRWLYSFGNFDGVHYITIARDGYARVAGIQAFFPLFPRIILGFFHDSLGLSRELLGIGLILSNFFFLGFLFLFFALIKEKFSEKVAWGSLFTILLFPTSFFFGSLYTESLFLLLVIGSFYSAEKKNWLVAGVLAGLASATRVVGIFLVPALLVEYWQSKEKNKAGLIWILLGSLGLLAYMMYLKTNFGDPLLFANVQAGFGAGRSTHIVLYPQVVWRALKILLTSPKNLAYITYLQEFIAGTFGLLAIGLAWKKVKPSWLLFSLLCFLFPPLTGTFSSMSRYLLVCFPIFILGGLLFERSPKTAFLTWVLSGAILVINTLLFIQGYWVA